MIILPINPTSNDFITTKSWKEYRFVPVAELENDILIHSTAYETSIEINEKINWEEIVKTSFTSILNEKLFETKVPVY